MMIVDRVQLELKVIVYSILGSHNTESVQGYCRTGTFHVMYYPR